MAREQEVGLVRPTIWPGSWVWSTPLALVALSACMSSEPPTEPPSESAAASEPAPPEAAGEDRIAFTRWAGDNAHPLLWTANIDGSDPAPVGDQVAWFPDWSPDRRLILFGFTDEDGDELRLADGGGDDTEPEYSPDGARIVFVRYRHDADDTRALHVAAADGSDVRRLTPWRHMIEHPRWSPDGRTIIYNLENNKDEPSNRGEGIWTVPASGGRPVLLLGSTDALHGFKPDYSPDGSRIVFACGVNQRTIESICVMNADGTDVEQVNVDPSYMNENHVVWR
jgi:TolB protein